MFIRAKSQLKVTENQYKLAKEKKEGEVCWLTKLERQEGVEKGYEGFQGLNSVLRSLYFLPLWLWGLPYFLLLM